MTRNIEAAKSNRMFRLLGAARDESLDPSFYTRYYGDLKSLSVRQAQRHWKDHGRSEGRYANPRMALATLLRSPQLPEDFDLEQHRDEAKQAREIRWDFEIIDFYLERVRVAPASDAETLAPQVTPLQSEVQARLRELPDGFNLASYLARNGDVRVAAADQPAWGILHFLADGCREGRAFGPDHVNYDFIEHVYKVRVPQSLGIDQVASYVRDIAEIEQIELLYLSEQEMFCCNGVVNDAVLTGFDPAFYTLQISPDLEMAINAFDAMRHFCEVGQYEALDISGALKFDPAFFMFEYGNSAQLDGSSPAAIISAEMRKSLFLAWLSADLSQPRSPNLRSWCQTNLDIDLPNEIEHRIRNWSIASSAEAGSRTAALLRPLIEGDLDIVGTIAINNSSVAEFFSSIADRLSIAGRNSEADAIYAQVLLEQPRHARALHHRADQAQRAKLFGLAASLRQQIIDTKRADVWTYLTQAECYKAIGMADRATESLQDGARAYPSDIALTRRAKTSAAHAFDALWERSTALAVQDIGDTQAKIRAALRRCTDRSEPAQIHIKIKRVALYASFDLAQCRFYRVDQKVEQLQQAGFEVLVFNYATSTNEYLTRLPDIDVTIVFRVPAFPYVIDALQRTTSFGIPTIYDIDDLVFDTDQFPPEISSYEGQVSRKHHAAMACGVPLFEYAMTLCDYALASTQALRPHMERRVRSGRSWLHENALGDLHLGFTECDQARKPLGDRTTLFYGSGTKAHKADFREILEPALVELFQEYGSAIRLILVGTVVPSPALDPYKHLIQSIEPMSRIDDYWDCLQTADINISVLSRSTFNDCKSEIKWLEAAMMAIPSVVSRSSTYEEVIEEGRTGFLCDGPADFGAALKRLIAEPELRVRVGEAARDVALARYSKRRMAQNLTSILSDIAASRPPARPRVLIVNVFYPPQAIGGATRVVHDNVRDLKDYAGQYEISVLCTLEGGTDPYAIDWYSLDGVRVARIATPDRPDIDKILEDVQMGAAFARCLDEIRPDLVHFHCIQRLTTSVVDVVRKRGVPYVITMHDGWWISPNQFLLGQSGEPAFYEFEPKQDARDGITPLPDRARVLKRHLKAAAKLTAVSPSFAELCASTGIGEVIAVENGLSAVPRRSRSLSAGRVRLGHLGGTELHKGLPLLRAILYATPFENLSLLVVDLSLQPGVSRTEVWGTTPVTIIAKTPSDEMPAVYGSIDVLVAPSIWPESFGLVTREAVASGCWVIASDRGAIGACVIEGQNGFIVDVSTPRGLRDILLKLDAEPDRFTSPPHDTPEIRPASAQAAELATIYEDLLAGRPIGKVAEAS